MVNMMAKISIITVVRNSSDTISDCMRSVQSQTYPNMEHIIQDGCSTDGTLEIIEKLQTRTTHLVSESDMGLYDALNKAINRATGEIIGILHSDDFYADARVLEKVALLFEDTNIDGVYADLAYVSKNDTHKIIRKWKSGSYNIEKLYYGWMPPHPTVFLKKSIYDDFGLYNLEYKISADYDVMLRYMLEGKIKLHYLPIEVVRMRVGGVSNRSMSNILQKMREDLKIINSQDLWGIGTLVLKSLRKLGQFFV